MAHQTSEARGVTSADVVLIRSPPDVGSFCRQRRDVATMAAPPAMTTNGQNIGP